MHKCLEILSDNFDSIKTWSKYESTTSQYNYLLSTLPSHDVENESYPCHCEVSMFHFVTSCKWLKNRPRWLHVGNAKWRHLKVKIGKMKMLPFGYRYHCNNLCSLWHQSNLTYTTCAVKDIRSFVEDETVKSPKGIFL